MLVVALPSAIEASSHIPIKAIPVAFVEDAEIACKIAAFKFLPIQIIIQLFDFLLDELEFLICLIEAQRAARFVPIEPRAEMAAQYQGPGKDNLLRMDGCRMDFEPFDVAICNLVMMFMAVGERAEFIAKLKAALKPGGAIIIVDKCEASTSYQATVLWRLTLVGKLAVGVAADQILAKELSLSGVQRPLDLAVLGEAAEWF